MSETPPPAHALRIEAHSDARHDFLTGHHLSAWLDGKPLSDVRSINIHIGAGEITTATLCFELGKLEIPNGIADLQIEHLQEDRREFRCNEPFEWDYDGVRYPITIGYVAVETSPVYQEHPEKFVPNDEHEAREMKQCSSCGHWH